MIVFELLEHADDGDHSFAVYDCRAEQEGDLVGVLATTIRDLYVDPGHLRDVLTAAMSDAGGVADGVAIEEAITRTLAAAIPEPGAHPIPQLDVARNELAEALAHIAFRSVHGTVIPAPRIRHKEVPDQPSRGRDLLGLEEAPLLAVIGEVKASDEEASPPGVVGSGSTSLRGQFLSFFAAEDALLGELNWALKHGGPEHQSLIAQAIVAHVGGSLPLCAAPVLVRPANVRGADDFGTFKDDPEQFAPAQIRFSVLAVDGALDELARVVYEEARR
jgi:hypothetical protein